MGIHISVSRCVIPMMKHIQLMLDREDMNANTLWAYTRLPGRNEVMDSTQKRCHSQFV